MVEWSILVVKEYEYLVKTKTVAQMGLSEFHVLPCFLKDPLQWKDNFTLLAQRLTNAPGGLTCTRYKCRFPNTSILFSSPLYMGVLSRRISMTYILPCKECSGSLA
jgi:hypothetical protein